MCLISEINKPTVATKDIICYKVVRVYSEKPNNWIPLYRGDYFPYNELIYAKGAKNIHIAYEINNTPYYCISEGFFHVLTKEKYANKLSKRFKKLYGHLFKNSPCCIVVKCIIPKGSEYYISSEGSEICSNRIIVLNLKI